MSQNSYLRTKPYAFIYVRLSMFECTLCNLIYPNAFTHIYNLRKLILNKRFFVSKTHLLKLKTVQTNFHSFKWALSQPYVWCFTFSNRFYFSSYFVFIKRMNKMTLDKLENLWITFDCVVCSLCLSLCYVIS